MWSCDKPLPLIINILYSPVGINHEQHKNIMSTTKGSCLNFQFFFLSAAHVGPKPRVSSNWAWLNSCSHRAVTTLLTPPNNTAIKLTANSRNNTAKMSAPPSVAL